MTSDRIEAVQVGDLRGGAAHASVRARAQRVRAHRLLTIVDRIEAAEQDGDPHARAVVERLRSIAHGTAGWSSVVRIDPVAAVDVVVAANAPGGKP